MKREVITKAKPCQGHIHAIGVKANKLVLLQIAKSLQQMFVPTPFQALLVYHFTRELYIDGR